MEVSAVEIIVYAALKNTIQLILASLAEKKTEEKNSVLALSEFLLLFSKS